MRSSDSGSSRKPRELRAEMYTLLARAFTGLAEAERLEGDLPTAQMHGGPQLLTRKAYVARFGTADGWSALESAAERGEIAAHRLGRSKAFDEADVIKVAASREPRKGTRPKALDDANPRAAYLALVGGGRS